MSFSAKEIEGMLNKYESDYHTGMNTEISANLIYDYTAGYPFLVSKLCKLIDERVAGSKKFPEKTDAWTKAGIIEAVKLLLNEKNTLFDNITCPSLFLIKPNISAASIEGFKELYRMVFPLKSNSYIIS